MTPEDHNEWAAAPSLVQTINRAEIHLWSILLERQKQALIAKNARMKKWFLDVALQDRDPLTGKETVFQSLPFLSIRAFKEEDIFYKSSNDCIQTFVSSGSTATTAGARGKHHFSMDGMLSYAHAAAGGLQLFFDRLGISQGIPIFCMVPQRVEWPHSSLAAMFELLEGQNFNVIWCSPETIHKAVSEFTFQARSSKKIT